MKHSFTASIAGLIAVTAGHSFAQEASTTFENGIQGWIGGNGTSLDAESDGNQHLRSVDETFGVFYTNNSNPGFLGDYTASDTITISIEQCTMANIQHHL